MANTISTRGGTVDHSKVAACNETMILMAKLEKLGWTHAELVVLFSEHTNPPNQRTVFAWSRGESPATTDERAEMRKLLKRGKGKGFDHSPKTPEEAAKHDAEREAAMIKAHGTTPVKLEKKQPKAKRAQPAEDARMITVLAKENPKRPGSKAHARFALYRTGMTVAQYLAAGGTSSDLAYNLEHGYVAVK